MRGERDPGATAAPVFHFCRRLSVDAHGFVHVPSCLGLGTLLSRANPIQATGRLETMTSIKSDKVERHRAGRRRDADGRRLTRVTATRRRLSATRLGASRNSASPFAPRDPRFDYLTHSHD